MKTKNLLPLSGIAFVILVAASVAASLATGIPDGRASPAEIAAYYDEHGWLQFAVSFVFAASVPFLVLFAISIAAARPAAAERPLVWERLLLGGSVVSGAVILVISLVNLALVDGAWNDASPVALETLNMLIGSVWVAHNAAFGVMMLGAAGTLLAQPRLNALGWTALVLGIALFIPVADFFALLLMGGWVIAAAVGLSRRPERHQVAQAAPSVS